MVTDHEQIILAKIQKAIDKAKVSGYAASYVLDEMKRFIKPLTMEDVDNVLEKYQAYHTSWTVKYAGRKYIAEEEQIKHLASFVQRRMYNHNFFVSATKASNYILGDNSPEDADKRYDEVVRGILGEMKRLQAEDKIERDINDII